jgi:uncharacterized protein DUF4154
MVERDSGEQGRRPQASVRLGALARAIAWAAALSLSVGGFSPVRGQKSRPSEYQVKAVYLFNFSRFVGWPQQAASAPVGPFAICVLGKDPFGSVLDATLAGESIQGRSVVARRVSQAQEAAGCQVVFISSSEENRLKEILPALEKSSVLTVSDIPRFSQHGGMIEFVLQGDRVRFEVNLASTTEAGLTLSSDLLKVAVAVRRNAQPGG